MKGSYLLSFIIFLSITCSGNSIIRSSSSDNAGMYQIVQDSSKAEQILFNGRLWRNLYYKVRENQFLFSDMFLPGAVSINGKSFNNLFLRYDIYTDEISVLANPGAVIQLNKEMVDSFFLGFSGKEYKFSKINSQSDYSRGFKGYINVLYTGKSSLYVKYKKEIKPLAVEGKYDLFFQTHRIYFMKEGVIYPVNLRSDFFKLLGEDKAQIKSYMKRNKLKVSKKIPESFIPLILYYDSIRK
jgi:hypothetical protein